MMSGTGHVISRDVSERKTGQIEENVERLGLSNIDVEVSDAAVHNIEDEDMADMLIADLPCSGIGIIGRKPDIKYNVSRDKIDGIIQLQRKILDSIYSDVKHGGYIVYSTCTLNSQENEENVRYIKSKGFEAVDITASLPEKLIDDAKRAGKHYYDKLIKDAADGMLTLIPGVYECDGFFVAKLKRI